MCGLYLATILVFYVRGRYRIPAVPLLIEFAAVAIERGLQAVKARRWPALGALGAGLIVAAVFTNHERCEAAHADLPTVCLGGDSWFDSEWFKLSQWHLERGEFDRAVSYAERARESTRPRRPGMVDAWLAGVEGQWTQTLVQAGRRDEAAAHFARAEEQYRAALRLGMDPGPLQGELGLLYHLVGKPAESVSAFEAAEKAGYLDPGSAPHFASAYIALGRCPDAERVMTKVDRALGFTRPSKETRAVLSACPGPR